MTGIGTAWGKHESSGKWLPLTGHMADVAACFEALIVLPLFRDRLARAMGREPDVVTLARLCVLAYLHDLGKLSSAFQAKAQDPTIKAGHSIQGWQIFRWDVGNAVEEALALPEIRSWGETVERLFLAALAHHGGQRRRPRSRLGLATARRLRSGRRGG